jgi:hypothetical protein
MKTKTKQGILAGTGWLLFFMMFGFIGGVECGTLPEGRGFIEALACLIGAYLVWRRAGMVVTD